MVMSDNKAPCSLCNVWRYICDLAPLVVNGQVRVACATGCETRKER